MIRKSLYVFGKCFIQFNQKLREELYSGQIAYEGMLFRDAVENEVLRSSRYLSEKEFVVAGFNALNGCEKKLFRSLQEKGNITFYWDFDEYYLKDLNQEAGFFMRENLKLFPQENIPYGINRLKQPKNFQIFHTPSQVGQAQIAAKEIATYLNETVDFDDTAIVLCDEELLLPVLSAIPAEIEKVNVTMGLPLKQTPLFSLISQLISLQKKNKRDGETLLFHYKSVIDVLNNQLIQAVHPIECKLIAENIVRKNQLFISDAELCTTKLFSKIFVCHETVSDLPGYFLAILYDLFLFWEKNNSQNYAVNYQEYIYQVYLSINKLDNTLFTEGTEIMGTRDFLTRETFFRLMLQYLSALSVTFEGEPLAGPPDHGYFGNTHPGF